MTFTLKKDNIQTRKTNGQQNAKYQALLVVPHFLSFFVSNIIFSSIFLFMHLSAYPHAKNQKGMAVYVQKSWLIQDTNFTP